MLCIRIGLTESSNMPYYSNASSREKSRRFMVINGGGLAWLLWQERGVVNTVDELGVAGSLRVYRKEVMEGEHNK